MGFPFQGGRQNPLHNLEGAEIHPRYIIKQLLLASFEANDAGRVGTVFVPFMVKGGVRWVYVK